MKVIQSIQRAINIINCFTNEKQHLSLSQISEKLSLNINTTRGIVNTLTHNGLLKYNKNSGDYILGSFFLAKANLSSKGLIEQIRGVAKIYLKQYAEEYNVSTRLQLVIGNEIMTIETINPSNAYYTLTCDEYVSFPLHATASGKLFLKYNQTKSMLKELQLTAFTQHTLSSVNSLKKDLKNIDKLGYAKEYEEVSIGISSLALPILDENKKLFATISLSGLTAVIEEVESTAMNELLALQKKITKEFLAVEH